MHTFFLRFFSQWKKSKKKVYIYTIRSDIRYPAGYPVFGFCYPVNIWYPAKSLSGTALISWHFYTIVALFGFSNKCDIFLHMEAQTPCICANIIDFFLNLIAGILWRCVFRYHRLMHMHRLMHITDLSISQIYAYATSKFILALYFKLSAYLLTH